jgi:putative transcriptional regulator
MASTHPSSDILELYANGSLSEGMEIFVKGHLHFCPTCRSKIELLEMVAGELLSDSVDASEITSPSFHNVLEKIEISNNNEKIETVTPSIKGGIMPIMINNFVGKTSDNINWRFRLPGISDYQISNENGEEISLLRAEPGAKVFQHTHEGEEATLVLSGALQDGEKVLYAGDVSVVNEQHTHNPAIIGDEPCICLIVMTGKVRFTGRFTRAINFLT